MENKVENKIIEIEKVEDKDTIYVSLSDIKIELERHMERYGDAKVTQLTFLPKSNGHIHILSGMGPESFKLKPMEGEQK